MRAVTTQLKGLPRPNHMAVKVRVATIEPKVLTSLRKTLTTQGTRSEIVTVTPEMAEKWLATYVVNRKIRNEAVAAYARDMATGKWEMNGSSIVFSSEGWLPDYNSPGGKIHVPSGTLLDGQHRLWACLDCNTPFTTTVVYGVDPHAWSTIDSGISRTTADMMVTEKNKNDLSAALTILWRYTRKKSIISNKDRATRHELFALLEKHPGLRDTITRASTYNSKTMNMLPKSSLAFFLYVFSSKDPVLGPQFIDWLQLGEGLHQTGKTAPVYFLRLHLQKALKTVGRSPLPERWASVIKAWNLMRAGAQTCSDRALVWRRYGEKPEKFPEIK